MSLKYGVTHSQNPLPVWVSVLLMAEKWGVPPWEIASSRSQTYWTTRFAVLENERARGANK